jgi:AbrB family looped-hinge helix DNA binding protein
MSKNLIHVDGAGRVVLPKPIRERFNLLPGDKLKLTADDSGIRLEPQDTAGKLIRKGRVLVFTGDFKERITDEAIQRILQEDREGRTDELGKALRRK